MLIFGQHRAQNRQQRLHGIKVRKIGATAITPQHGVASLVPLLSQHVSYGTYLVQAEEQSVPCGQPSLFSFVNWSDPFLATMFTVFVRRLGRSRHPYFCVKNMRP
jgi:hypothetical protein